MAVTQTKDGRWYCYYRQKRNNGKSYIKKEYFGRGPEAEAAARKRDGELGLKKRRPRKLLADPGPTFGDLAKAYLLYKNFSKNSAKHLKIRLNANVYPSFDVKIAIKITDQDLDNYVQKRRRDGVKYSTIHREITDIKAILNWAVSRRPPLIKFNPVRDYKKPKPDYEVILPPTQDETRRIMAKASPHLLRAIMLSYYLGLRPGSVELLSLKWDNVNWGANIILVASAHKGGPVKREVPIMHEDFLKLLTKWYKEDKGEGFIVHYNGKPIKKILKGWKSALKRAGITRRLRPYDLRHNFITQALERGADMKALSEIVGSSPETIMKFYQHVTSDIHRQTVAKIPAIGLEGDFFGDTIYPQKTGKGQGGKNNKRD